MDEYENNDGEAKDDGAHPSEITGLARRLAFLELDVEDRQRLQELASYLAPHQQEFVEAFYQHLFAFTETARFLQEPALVERLKQSQQEHLDSMLAAEWSDEYVARRFRVGEVHAQVGISPQIFLGAYNQYLKFSMDLLAAKFAMSHEHAEVVRSLQKAVFFDIGLTLEAYFSRATSNLRKALDLVYKANTELRQFAQLTSHDLKTPLATMANLCDEVLDEFGKEIPPDAGKLIQAARNRAFRMSATIDELLKSASSLHEDQAAEVVSLDEVIAEAVDRLRPMIDQKQIDLRVAAGMPRVRGSFAQLREVFYNLLANAVKFTDKAQPQIDVGFVLRNGDCIVSIVDNGSGIPSDELSRVFVPFRRLPAHKNIPGSGLGLYFAKTIIEQQQGRIWVESELGKGSQFRVALKTFAADRGAD